MSDPTTTARLAPIDRTSYEPAYVQLVNILSHAIASGQYRAGDQLPTEAELCAVYDVSPMTVRRAIGVLRSRIGDLRGDARLESLAARVVDGDTEVSVLIPRRHYTQIWHRFLHDRTSMAISAGRRKSGG